MPLPQLPVVPADKANHFVYGSALFLILGSLAQWAEVPYHLTVAAVAVAAVAIWKEYEDNAMNKSLAEQGQLPAHGVEYADVMWTLAGAAVVALGSYL